MCSLIIDSIVMTCGEYPSHDQALEDLLLEGTIKLQYL